MILTEAEATEAIRLLAIALGFPPSQFNRISILSTRRRNLLSTGTTTFKITATSQEQANMFSAQLTYAYLLNTVFRNSTVTPPTAIISVGVVDLHPPPTTTPAPTATPSPEEPMSLIPIIAGAGGGVAFLIIVGTLGYLGATGKLQSKPKQLEAQDEIRSQIKIGPLPMLKVRINRKMS